MLNEKDLMLQDIVMATIVEWVEKEEGEKISSHPCKIIVLPCEYVHFLDNYECDEYMVKEIEPIPLTREILEMNGFVYEEKEKTCASDEYHEWHLKEHPTFSIEDDSWWQYEAQKMFKVKFGAMSLKYVHELQNLMRMRGLYENADNFKIN